MNNRLTAPIVEKYMAALSTPEFPFTVATSQCIESDALAVRLTNLSGTLFVQLNLTPDDLTLSADALVERCGRHAIMQLRHLQRASISDQTSKVDGQ